MTELEDAKRAITELIADYNAAAKIHVPNWKGGMKRQIAEELIRMGWRRGVEARLGEHS